MNPSLNLLYHLFIRFIIIIIVFFFFFSSSCQVVTLVLYTYFIAALLGRQMIPKVDGALPTGKYEDPDLYFPLFTALQVSLFIN